MSLFRLLLRQIRKLRANYTKTRIIRAMERQRGQLSGDFFGPLDPNLMTTDELETVVRLLAKYPPSIHKDASRFSEEDSRELFRILFNQKDRRESSN